MMNKIFGAIVAVFILCLSCSVAEEQVKTFVSIFFPDEGYILAHREVSVWDTDGDGTLTFNDALNATHDQFYPGGANAGYRCSNDCIGKLWGREGSFGFYFNDRVVKAVSAKVLDEDQIIVYSFSDTHGHSDKVSFFDIEFAEVEPGESLTLTARYVGAYASRVALQNCDVMINNLPAGMRTDERGEVSIEFQQPGVKLVTTSCTLNGAFVVPAFCVVNVTGSSSQTSSQSSSHDPSQASSQSFSLISSDSSSHSSSHGSSQASQISYQTPSDSSSRSSSHGSSQASPCPVGYKGDNCDVKKKLIILEMENSTVRSDVTLDDIADALEHLTGIGKTFFFVEIESEEGYIEKIRLILDDDDLCADVVEDIRSCMSESVQH